MRKTTSQTANTPARATRPSLPATATRVALAALVLFHGWLLGRRLGDGSFDTTIVARWLGAALVVALFVWIGRLARQQGRRNRRADLVLWSLVLLIHSGGTAPLTPAGEALQVLPLAELGALALPLSLMGLTLGLWQATLRPTALGLAHFRTWVATLWPRGIQLDFRLFCRPPPVQISTALG